MHFRNILLSAAALAALSPSISNATAEQDALKSCAKAFAASIAAPGDAAPTYKVDYRGQNTGALTAYYERQFTFELKAHNAKTGLTVARATCSVDAAGNIVALISTPLDTAAPALASRF